ncbi:ribonuclease T2 family protein [Legionella waltersii]|uniref:Ribonuclease, T2 family n=1 Tax=Legionella waltersii TaxID=66969 RepID=A0A0W1A4S2_9GAMM|nr:ribonuclease T [Legionella waltersii]KTD76353.1 ribonuclease, T2 family [Legionella waltersii]SNV13905.1 ribonuclease, T2 family [Legionella waltersii]
MIKLISLLILSFSFSINASTSVSGSLLATKSCPAYLSKNQKTNPGDLKTEPGQQYPLKEINKTPPDWLRIQYSEDPKSLRWVKIDCGTVEYTEHGKSHCELSPGMADAHVLALSSQPGFCETYGVEVGKPECLKLSKKSYQVNHLSLHGLWPNQDACGHNYGYCGVMPKSSHCDYSPVDLSTAVSNDLKKTMPSYNYGSCLERHEWNKHGTCQSYTSDEYFSLAIRLTKEMNETIFGKYLTDHSGEIVKLSDLREAIKQSFGKDNSDKITLSCKNGILVDIYIQLPAVISYQASIQSLVDKATVDHQHQDYCNSSITISNFSRENLLPTN